MREILTPPAFPDAALGELKQWLAITTAGEDAALSILLLTALEIFEGHTGQMALETECEQVLPACRGRWQRLGTHPVRAISQAEGIPAEGARFLLQASAYAVQLHADGGARFYLARQGAAGRIAIRFTAGLATQWNDLPQAIRHGTIRLAAHLYGLRDSGEQASQSLPSCVTALWRPWQRVRLL